MIKLLKYLKSYMSETILGPLFKLFEASFELIVPLIVAKIIDKGILQSDKPYIIKMCLVLILLTVVGLICSVTAQYFAAKASAGFAKKIRHSLFEHINSFSFSEIDEIGTATLITRMTSDMNQVQSGVNLTLRLLLRSPFIVLGAMIMAFTINAKAALTFVVAIPLLSIVVFGIMIICIPLYKGVQDRIDKILGRVRENLNGVKVIRGFCKEKEEISEFKASNSRLVAIQNLAGRISALMNPITFIIINLSIIALIYSGALRVSEGIITQGAVVALYNYMSQILVELIKLAGFIISLTKAIACGNRVQAVFETGNKMKIPEIMVKSQQDQYIIEFENVDLNYNGSSENTLNNINFKIKRGEMIGIIGSTGSGKTSLVDLIPRFYDVSCGAVSVDGINVKDYSLEELGAKIAVVPQKSVLFKGTIRENMLWGNPNATDREIYNALEIAQASQILKNKDGELNYIIEQGGKNLSGGQKQRLAIARAILKKSEILILDDSSSALDFATEAALRKAIRSMKNGVTVLVVSQRAGAVLSADNIIVLDDGAVAGFGKNSELLETCEVYKEIYYSQFEREA